MTRTLKLDLEARLGQVLSVSKLVLPWLVLHAAAIHNKYVMGTDGRTAWARLKGKKYSGEIWEFFQPVFFRTVGKVQGGVLSGRWFTGHWLG